MRSVIFSVSGMPAAEESIRLSARTRECGSWRALHSSKERDALRKAGADQAFSGKARWRWTLTESISASLGATGRVFTGNGQGARGNE